MIQPLDDILYVFDIDDVIEIFDALNLYEFPSFGQEITFGKNYLPHDNIFKEIIKEHGNSYIVTKIRKESFVGKKTNPVLNKFQDKSKVLVLLQSSL
jgi:hypothetical protein